MENSHYRQASPSSLPSTSRRKPIFGPEKGFLGMYVKPLLGASCALNNAFLLTGGGLTVSNAQKNLYSVEETSERLGVSIFTIRRLIRSGNLKSRNISARIMVPRTEIERAEQFGVGKPRNKAVQ
jgi:excisionase family DNA binding protein